MTVLTILMLMQIPGSRDIVNYWPGPQAFSVVQKPWGWAHISVQKPRGDGNRSNWYLHYFKDRQEYHVLKYNIWGRERMWAKLKHKLSTISELTLYNENLTYNYHQTYSVSMSLSSPPSVYMIWCSRGHLLKEILLSWMFKYTPRLIRL